MKIREANRADLVNILDLFENTIRAINRKDYTNAQIEVWANAKNKKIWESKIEEQFFYVAEINNEIVGFSSIDSQGYLDFMYVHMDYQARGVASQLLKKIEEKSRNLRIEELWASVSITAQPFFVKKGFEKTKDEIKQVRGVEFINCIMIKKLKNDL